MHPEKQVGCTQIVLFSVSPDRMDPLSPLYCNRTATAAFPPRCPHPQWISQTINSLPPSRNVIRSISQYELESSANPSRLKVNPHPSSCFLDPLPSRISSSVTGNCLRLPFLSDPTPNGWRRPSPLIFLLPPLPNIPASNTSRLSLWTHQQSWSAK